MPPLESNLVSIKQLKLVKAELPNGPKKLGRKHKDSYKTKAFIFTKHLQY
jgi:hypothetical protein